MRDPASNKRLQAPKDQYPGLSQMHATHVRTDSYVYTTHTHTKIKTNERRNASLAAPGGCESGSRGESMAPNCAEGRGASVGRHHTEDPSVKLVWDALDRNTEADVFCAGLLRAFRSVGGGGASEA